ncbi:methyltransferase [Massilia sp. DWR3-1-1]|uniref:methyltransferase n=1 Tax=Massilia sp. DWR3-1-1 TaxID=2804559 RepID=UPI003CE7D897
MTPNFATLPATAPPPVDHRMSAAGTDGSAHHALLALGRYLANAGYRHTAISAASHQSVVRRVASAPARALTLNDIFGLSLQFSADTLHQSVWGAMNQAGIVRRDGAGWRSTLRVASAAGHAGSGGHGGARPLLFFHSAYPTLDDDAVFFDPDSYRFLRALRPALSQAPVRRAIDIGCGAGAGAIAIARRWPEAQVLAADLNEKARTLTAVNADLAGARHVRTVHSDGLASVDGDFDLIVAHRPYLLDPCGRTLRHGGGLQGETGCVEIVRAAIGRLAPGGRLLLYTGVAMVGGVDPLLARLAPLLDGAGLAWRYEEIDTDIHGEELAEVGYEQADRIAAVWLEARRTA